MAETLQLRIKLKDPGAAKEVVVRQVDDLHSKDDVTDKVSLFLNLYPRETHTYHVFYKNKEGSFVERKEAALMRMGWHLSAIRPRAIGRNQDPAETAHKLGKVIDRMENVLGDQQERYDSLMKELSASYKSFKVFYSDADGKTQETPSYRTPRTAVSMASNIVEQGLGKTMRLAVSENPEPLRYTQSLDVKDLNFLINCLRRLDMQMGHQFDQSKVKTVKNGNPPPSSARGQ